MSASFVTVASSCPDVDADSLGLELRAAFLCKQGRPGLDKVLDRRANMAVCGAETILPDAENVIQEAGEFYFLIGHLLPGSSAL